MPEPAATASAWRLLGASVTGRAHLTRGSGNQDALAAATARDGSLLLAVADGAGSAAHSATGARVAVETALSSLAASDLNSPEAALSAALAKAARALNAMARRRGELPREYACTLLLSIATPELVCALQLGDGAIIYESAGQVARLTRAWRSKFAGETVFVTSPDAQEQASIARLDAAGINGLALLTDGLEPVATDLTSGVPFAPFFVPLFNFTSATGHDTDQLRRSNQLTELLDSERIRSRTHDDTTLLLAARHTGQ